MSFKKIAVLLIFIALLAFVLVKVVKNTSIIDQKLGLVDKNEVMTNNAQTFQDTNNDKPAKYINLEPQKITVNGAEYTLNLPNFFEIEVFADGFEAARGITTDENNNLYVTDKGRGEVVLITQSGDKFVVDTGLQNVHGIDFYKGNLYVGEEHQVSVYKNINPEKGTFSEKQILVADLPSDSGHSTRTVRIGPDEKLYVAIGSSCNVCEEDDERRAAIMRYNLDGTDGELFAEGLRNTVDIDFNQNGNLWGVDNGRDLIGDDIPVEEVNLIKQGNHYGWPYCHSNKVTNPEFTEFADFCANESASPAVGMQAHSAPLGLALYEYNQMQEFPNFPQDVDKNMFVAFHGSWNRSTPTGYKVVRIPFSGYNSGNYTQDATINFITGWLLEDGTSWGRPVDVEFDRHGLLYITDDKAGVVYRVKHTTQAPTQ